MTSTMISLETRRFGHLQVEEADVIHLAEPMIGFENQTRFVIIEHKPGSVFRWFQSLDNGDLAFLMVDPAQYVPDYAPEMPGKAVKRLGLAQETPRLVYTIANIPSGHPEKMTLNLAGPIVINAENRQAVQVILEDLAYPTRHQVFADSAAA